MNHEYIKEQKTANVFSFILDGNGLMFPYSEKNKKIEKNLPFTFYIS